MASKKYSKEFWDSRPIDVPPLGQGDYANKKTRVQKPRYNNNRKKYKFDLGSFFSQYSRAISGLPPAGQRTLQKKKLSDYRKNFGSLTRAAANSINRDRNKSNNKNKKAEDLKVIMERWAYENSTKNPKGGFSSYSGSVTADTKGRVKRNTGMTAEESRARNTFRGKK